MKNYKMGLKQLQKSADRSIEEEERIEDVNTVNVEDTESVRWEGVRKKEKSKVISTTILEKQYSKTKEPDINANSIDIGNSDISKDLDIKDLDTIEGAIPVNTVWHQIRKGFKRGAS